VELPVDSWSYRADRQRVIVIGGAALFTAVLLVSAVSGAAVGFDVFGALVTAGAWYIALVHWSYEVAIDGDGGVSFTSVLRRRSTRAQDIDRITVGGAFGGGGYLRFWFPGGRAQIMQTTGAVELISRVRHWNPTVEVKGL
jgi:hypothetical protein